MNETAQSEESAADESVTQATLGKVAEESRAIASEAEITAIEEGGGQSVGGGISNPADRRLPRDDHGQGGPGRREVAEPPQPVLYRARTDGPRYRAADSGG